MQSSTAAYSSRVESLALHYQVHLRFFADKPVSISLGSPHHSRSERFELTMHCCGTYLQPRNQVHQSQYESASVSGPEAVL